MPLRPSLVRSQSRAHTPGDAGEVETSIEASSDHETCSATGRRGISGYNTACAVRAASTRRCSSRTSGPALHSILKVRVPPSPTPPNYELRQTKRSVSRLCRAACSFALRSSAKLFQAFLRTTFDHLIGIAIGLRDHLGQLAGVCHSGLERFLDELCCWALAVAMGSAALRLPAIDIAS